MAGQINTRFVIILSTIIVVMIGAAALLVPMIMRDAEDMIARAEQYLAEGDYDRAVESLQIAINKSHSDPRIIQKYLEVAKDEPAADVVDATNTLRDVQGKTLALASLDVESEQYLRDYADLTKHMISKLRLSGGLDPMLKNIYQAAMTRLEAEPDDKLARRYRGIYGLVLLDPEMPQEDINLVRDDLLWAMEEYPNDPEVRNSLARWKLFEARMLDVPGGNPDKAKTLREEAVEISQALVDEAPEDTSRLIDHLLVMYNVSIRAEDIDRDDPFAAVKPLLSKIEQRLLADPKPFNDVSTVVQYLKSVYAKDLGEEAEADAEEAPLNQGIVRSLALLERASEANPDDLRYNLLLGIALKEAAQYDEAKPHLKMIADLETKGQYLDVILNARMKRAAEFEYADLLISLSQFVETQEEREALYAEAEQLVDKFDNSGEGELPNVLLIKGRLALAQNKTREGLISIDKAAELYGGNSRKRAETLLLSARAREKQGDWGAAADRYEQLLQANPNIPVIRLALANNYLRQREMDKAQDHLDAVLVDEPENERALLIQAGIQAARGDLDGAISTYRQLGLPNRPELAVGLSQLMVQGDRKDQAVQMLQHYFDADPTNLSILTALLTIQDDADRRNELIAQSRAAGGDAETLSLFEQRLDPENAGDIDQIIESRLASVEDPFLREIQGARIYAQIGKEDKAREALAAAAKIDPEHKAVIDMQFGYALQDGDMELAQKLADEAARRDLDEAGGRFYLGQLQKAQGDYAAAINTFRAGLDIVQINSEGWRLLGDVYVANDNSQDAVTAYETAIKQKPDNLRAIRGLASIRDKQGRHDEALAMLRKAQQQNPGNAQLQDLYLSYEARYGDKQLALRLRRDINAKQPENSNNIRALAVLLATTGKTDEAIQLMRQLIETEGETQLNSLALANVHLSAGEPEQGANVIKRYVQSKGTQANVADYLLLARFLIQINDGQGAFNAYQEAIKVESDMREASRELAGLFFRRGAFDRSTPLLRDLFKQFPDNNEIGLRFADSLIRTAAFDEAEQVLDRVDGGSTENALRALIAYQRGDSDLALQLINSAISESPGNAPFYYERAAFNAKDPDKTDQVIQDLNTALSHDPTHLLSRRMLVNMYQLRGERNEAIRELNTMIARHPDYSEGRLTLIRIYTQDGSLDRAKTLARQGLEQAPDDPTWHAVLGDLAMRENAIGQAIAAYEKVFELAPSAGQLLKIATIQVENGRAQAAQALLREHADMVNPQPILQAVMARALYANGRTDEARQVFSRAAEACSGLDQFFGVAMQIRKDYTFDETAALLNSLTNLPNQSWLGLALARMELSEGQAQQALSRAKALESQLSGGNSPERLALDQVMAAALHQTGDPQQAQSFYERLIELRPDDSTTLNNYAYMLAEDLNRPEDALPMAERAAEMAPKNAQVLDTLGWIQFKLGKTDEARRTLENSITVESLPANHLHLAELMIGQGYRAEASRHLQTAIDLAEQNNDTQVLERAKQLQKQTDDLTEAS